MVSNEVITDNDLTVASQLREALLNRICDKCDNVLWDHDFDIDTLDFICKEQTS